MQENPNVCIDVSAKTESRVVLASCMNKVYGWMALALSVTALCAYLAGTDAYLMNLFLKNKFLFFGLMIAEVLLVIGISAMINKMAAATAAALFIFYAMLNGLTMSVIFTIYPLGSIAAAFGVTAAAFAVMSCYGYFTKRSLATLGSICYMAVIGIVIAMLVNMFIGSGLMNYIISCISVLVFTGLAAYDTQKTKQMLQQAEFSTEVIGKIAILGALSLYLDFINLFLSILSIFGDRK